MGPAGLIVGRRDFDISAKNSSRLPSEGGAISALLWTAGELSVPTGP